jgi:hypothetical protein
MKEQETPEGVLELQKSRLSKEEYDFCGKLFRKLQKMETITREHRQKVLDFITSYCKGSKFKVNLTPFEEAPKELEIYNLFINDKNCFVVFNLEVPNPVNLIPSGIIGPLTN